MEATQELMQLERRFWQAMKDRDVEEAKKLTDFPCLVSGPQGIGALDEETFTKMMTNGSYRIDRFDLSDGAQARMLGDDVAVLAYRVHEDLHVDGKPVSLDAAESSTWVKRDGKWVCAQHSEALAGDPFGRDRVRAGAQANARGPKGGSHPGGREHQPPVGWVREARARGAAARTGDKHARGGGEQRTRGGGEQQARGGGELEAEGAKEQTQPARGRAQRSADEDAIRALVSRWLRASEAHDVPTLMELMAEDVVFQVPGEAPFGKRAFERRAGGVTSSRMKLLNCTIEEVKVLGDWAFCRTHLNVELTPPGLPTYRQEGHTLSIFRKADSGSWQLTRDCSALLEKSAGGERGSQVAPAWRTRSDQG